MKAHTTANLIRLFAPLMHVPMIEGESEIKSENSYEKIVYQAASPDEAALVDAARRLGFEFFVRSLGFASK